MPNNDKREMFFFFLMGNKLGKCKQGLQKIGNDMQNKLDRLFQLFLEI